MIHPRTDAPFLHMIEETDDNRGDFRRVPPQIWHFFQLWYGGGPAISVVGPPIEGTVCIALYLCTALLLYLLSMHAILIYFLTYAVQYNCDTFS